MLNEYNVALQSQANFTIGLLNQIINSNEGVSISPYSLTLALTMCYIGAGGETEIEFKKLLSPNIEKTKFCEFLENSINNIYLSSTNGTEIYIANKLFIQEDCTIEEKFKEKLKKYLKATFENVDFGDTITTAKIINDFVKNITHGKIDKLISSSDISSLTTSILTNALYFKSQWKEKFDERLTKEDEFFTTSTKKKTVKMMNKKGKMLYGNDKNFHVVKIPYSNNDCSFVIVLPRVKNMLHPLLYNFDYNNLLNLIHSTAHENIIFSMPKFKVESSHSLKEPLIKMGLVTAFENGANFSSMTLKNDLKIDAVVQKVYVDVNEEGTEAAAATGVIMVMKSAPMPYREEIIVKANHPFLYFILNRSDILISGVYQ